MIIFEKIKKNEDHLFSISYSLINDNKLLFFRFSFYTLNKLNMIFQINKLCKPNLNWNKNNTNLDSSASWFCLDEISNCNFIHLFIYSKKKEIEREREKARAREGEKEIIIV